MKEVEFECIEFYFFYTLMNVPMYLISYDIEKDSLRTQIGNKIIEYGLTRIQYSVYLGYLKQTDYQELSRIIKIAIWVKKLDIEEWIDKKAPDFLKYRYYILYLRYNEFFEVTVA